MSNALDHVTLAGDEREPVVKALVEAGIGIRRVDDAEPELERIFLEHVEGSEADQLVIHMGGLGRVDLSGALVLAQLVVDAEEAGVDVEFVEVPDHARRVLRRVFPSRAANDPVKTT